MTLRMLFWILMIVWLLFGFWVYWPGADKRTFGGHFIVWVLLLLLGLRVFGFPISG